MILLILLGALRTLGVGVLIIRSLATTGGRVLDLLVLVFLMLLGILLRAFRILLANLLRLLLLNLAVLSGLLLFVIVSLLFLS